MSLPESVPHECATTETPARARTLRGSAARSAQRQAVNRPTVQQDGYAGGGADPRPDGREQVEAQDGGVPPARGFHSTTNTPAPNPDPGRRPAVPSEAEIPDLYRTPPAPVVTPMRRALNAWRRRNERGRTEEQNDELIAAALARLTDKFYVIPVIGPKGGSGKTLLSLVCGLILSEYRNARPCLLEANMDWGTLRDLLGDANPRTIKHLLTDLPEVERAGYGALQGYLTMFGRLPVLTAPTNPDDMQALTPGDYDKVVSLLSKHMQILFLDCGTSFVNRISQYAAQTADHTVLVAAPDNPTMRRSIASAHYLASARYVSTYKEVMPDLTVLGEKRDLTRVAMGSMTLAVNGIGKSSKEVPLDYDALGKQLPDMNGIVKLPYSERLEALINTGRLDMEVLPPTYRRQAKSLLATVLTRMAEARDTEPRH